MKKKFRLLAGALVLTALCGVPVSAKSKVASVSQPYYSWCGIKIFTNGGKGWYEANGSKITSYGGTAYTGSTGIAWSSCNEKAKWVSKGTTSGTLSANAKFVLGIATDKFSLGVQSCWQTDTASATKY